MGALLVDGPNSPFVKSAEEMAGRFSAELMGLMPVWKERLLRDPGGLCELEVDVHAAFARGADLVVTGLLALVMKQPTFVDSSKATRQGFSQPLRRGRERKIQLRLLGGLLVWATSLYCAVRRPKDSATQERKRGVYVELAQFGFGKGCSPALESAVGRQAALCPSFQFAAERIQRPGGTAIQQPQPATDPRRHADRPLDAHGRDHAGAERNCAGRLGDRGLGRGVPARPQNLVGYPKKETIQRPFISGYDTWRANFGRTAGSGAFVAESLRDSDVSVSEKLPYDAISEPATLWLLVIAGGLLHLRRRVPRRATRPPLSYFRPRPVHVCRGVPCNGS